MNLAQWQSDTDMKAALSEQKIAVVGLSVNPARPSHDVARVMQNLGYTIVPINPREEHVLGARSYPDLSTAVAETGPIALVNVFRESSAVPAIAEEAVTIGARFLWRNCHKHRRGSDCAGSGLLALWIAVGEYRRLYGFAG